MTKLQVMNEALTYAIVIVFAIGWMDFGQGKDLTWWKLIQTLANQGLTADSNGAILIE